MYLKQLSVFIENREGRLEEVLNILKKNEINIAALSLADTADYGMLRMIVSNPEEGRNALKRSGFTAMLTDVIAIKLAHKAGQLQELLSLICKAEINVEYMYTISTQMDDASVVMKTSDLTKCEEILKIDGVELITLQDISNL